VTPVLSKTNRLIWTFYLLLGLGVLQQFVTIAKALDIHPNDVDLELNQLFPSTVQVVGIETQTYSALGMEIDWPRDKCSAVKISKHTFLTAAHCVVVFSGKKIFIKSIHFEELTVRVNDFRSHPNFKEGDYSTYNFDLAVAEIAEKTPNIPIAKLSQIEQFRSNSTVYMGGYGKSVHFGSNYFLMDQRKIYAASEGWIAISYNKRWKFRSSLNVGDSGGPLFTYNAETMEFEVVGVNSLIAPFVAKRLFRDLNGRASWMASTLGVDRTDWIMEQK
jgi:V8-like Glu-specific endopeptidase